MSIYFEGVDFFYEEDPILLGVNLTLEKGQFVVVVGPNGAGKTTFLRLAAGLLTPTKGIVQVEGEVPKAAQEQGKIHIVPQIYNKNTSQFPATVEELVGLLLYLEKSVDAKERENRITEALALVGMSEYRYRRIGELSGGQQQRIMIAQALVRKATVLLFDEPTSGIDFRAGEHILALLERLAKEKNLLIVMVTHDIVKGLEYADEVVCLNQDVCYAGDVEGFKKTHMESALAWHIGG